MVYDIIWIFYFIFLRNTTLGKFGQLYQAIEACVFDPLQRFSISSPILCALKCYSFNCKGFTIDAINSSCVLYEYLDICQSNTDCPNQKVFVNNRNNNMVIIFSYYEFNNVFISTPGILVVQDFNF